ncbi:hypothetical protein HMPREF0556_12027 [Listeria grayi DSM 20601]|uniref:Uncharacterized protein n=1 Tax=Listeria grayi DSM 20601 TaxID=525367 RepID=D7V1B0_LISGR|nr:hypothetical protein HMPREF0556_12027 [Listeria grayi DSM 20601]
MTCHSPPLSSPALLQLPYSRNISYHVYPRKERTYNLSSNFYILRLRKYDRIKRKREGDCYRYTSYHCQQRKTRGTAHLLSKLFTAKTAEWCCFRRKEKRDHYYRL